LKSYHTEESWLSWMDELSNKDYVIIDDFCREDLYQDLKLMFQDRLPFFSQAGIGALDLNTVHEEIRGDQTYWLDRKRDIEIEAFWQLIDESIYMLNRYCFLSLSGYEFHFANYPIGGHYAKHLDQFQQRNNRMISFIIYMNDDWKPEDGGQLEIFPKRKASLKIDPLARRCVLFKSAELPHRVLKANKERRSLTGWLLYTPSHLGQFLG